MTLVTRTVNKRITLSKNKISKAVNESHNQSLSRSDFVLHCHKQSKMWRTFLLLIFINIGGVLCDGNVGSSTSLTVSSPGGRCEEIAIPMCRGIGYNLTAMPNDLNHDTQEEAGLEVHQFWPLVEIDCSTDLKFFLCSIYAPICIEDYHKPLRACRSVCERARSGCEPIMKQYGFSWPERMNCDLLPVFGENPEELCMDNQQGASESKPSKPTRRPQVNRCKNGKGGPKNCQGTPQGGREPGTTTGERTRQGHTTDNACGCRCRQPLVNLGASLPSTDHYLHQHHLAMVPPVLPRDNRSVISVGGVENCAYPCRGAFFTGEERQFAAAWIALWSGLCAASTLMTLTTFLIDPDRFKYPERPIIFLSACYFLVACGYLVRVAVGHDHVACDGNIVRYSMHNLTGGPAGHCTLVFLLVYFFGMASSIWWVVLSFTWFLAAGLKWGNEAISSYAPYFHLAAWLVPTAQTVAVLIASAVDGDPVSGICYVGNMSPDNLRTYVWAPLLAYLVLGTSFLIAGFVSLFRIRSVIKRQGGASKADKLEKLMIRIGIFSVLYTLPAAIVLSCHLYEAAHYDEWGLSMACACRPRERPLYAVLMLKYFMALAVGITSGVWIWSGKTLDSWKRFWRRLCGGGSGGHVHGDPSGAAAVLIKPRVQPPVGCYAPPPGASSVASASQHHLHHHVLKQPPLSHV